MTERIGNIGAEMYWCVGGPLDGQMVSINPDVNSTFTIRGEDGDVRYELRREGEGEQCLYFVPEGVHFRSTS